MGAYDFAAVSLGAGLGASLRWWLCHRLNPVFSTLPLGTLAANLLGGFLIGLAAALISRHPSLTSETQLQELVERERIRIFYAHIPARFGVLNPDEDNPPFAAQDAQEARL